MSVELGRPSSPAGFVAIEDSRWGIEAAVAAGLPCVGVTTTYDAGALPGAAAIVSRLADIGPPFAGRPVPSARCGRDSGVNSRTPGVDVRARPVAEWKQVTSVVSADFIRRFTEVAKAPSPDLAPAALAIARIEYPQLDASRYLRALDRMGAAAADRIAALGADADLLRRIAGISALSVQGAGIRR